MSGGCDCQSCYRRNRSCILCFCMFLFIVAAIAIAIVFISGVLMIVQVFQLIGDARPEDSYVTRDELIKSFFDHWLVMSASFFLLILISLLYLCMHLSCICNLIRANRNIEKQKKAKNDKGTESSPLLKKKGKLVVGKDRGVIDMDHAREEVY